MDAEHLCDLGSRLVSLDRFDGDLGLQAGWVTLAGFGHWLSSILNAAHHLRKSLFSVQKMGSTTVLRVSARPRPFQYIAEDADTEPKNPFRDKNLTNTLRATRGLRDRSDGCLRPS